MNKIVKLNETQLRRLVKNVATQYLNEMYDEGCDEGWISNMFKEKPLPETVAKEFETRMPNAFDIEPVDDRKQVKILNKKTGKPVGDILDAGEFYSGHFNGCPSFHDRSIATVVGLMIDYYKSRMKIAESVNRVVRQYLG